MPARQRSWMRKNQIMRDKPNNSAVRAACLAAAPGRASGISPLYDVYRSKKSNAFSGIEQCSLSLAKIADTARCWWSQTGSNRRPEACKATALPTELWPLNQTTSHRLMVGLGRVELPTSRLSGVRSNHLSYRPGVLS